MSIQRSAQKAMGKIPIFYGSFTYTAGGMDRQNPRSGNALSHHSFIFDQSQAFGPVFRRVHVAEAQ